MLISRRSVLDDCVDKLLCSGYSPTMARVLAARGITEPKQMDTSLSGLPSPAELKGSQRMAELIADGIANKQKFLVVADYDSDGATACAVAVRGLRKFGANIDFMVPNRFEHGYGLTPEIVQLVAKQHPDYILTVDNGIASVDGVAEANRLGIKVLVTDHHLPGDVLPDAECIVNPNQPGCPFPNKNLAGVGVMYYVLFALRAELRKRGAFAGKVEPVLNDLLDLVALGTVADVVKLEQGNRILVEQGLQRMRSGKACVGIAALFNVAGKDPSLANCQHLGFLIAPRLNAAGRIDDMSLGINCLITDDPVVATEIASRLDALNRERRSIETTMQDSALAALDKVNPEAGFTLALFDKDWHQGVIGIVASRLKDKYNRPTIIFAQSASGELKGSGRSIPGLHLRDALDVVSKRYPSLIKKFGGHSAAAGLSIGENDFEQFVTAFELCVSEMLDADDLQQKLETDGCIIPNDMTLDLVRVLDAQVWGQGFPAPLFDDEFTVAAQKVVGEKHLKLSLTKQGLSVDAILFGCAEPLPDQVRLVYNLAINEYRGHESLQLIVRHWEKMGVGV